MKKQAAIYGVVLSAGLFCSSCDTPRMADNHVQTLMEAVRDSAYDANLAETPLQMQKQNHFGWQLFQKIAAKHPKESQFFSPLGAIYSLNILNEGASGKTREEINKAMDITEQDRADINKLSRNEMIMLAQNVSKVENYTREQSYLRVVNAMVLKDTASLNEDCCQQLELNYFLGIMSAKTDLQKQVDEWCMLQTDSMIQHLSVPSSSPDLKAILLSANRFHGIWEEKFDASNTKREPFKKGNSKEVDMMNLETMGGFFGIAEKPDFRMLNMMYKGGGYVYILVPKKQDGLDELIHKMRYGEFSSAAEKFKYYDKTYLKVPKFKVDREYDLGEPFKELGIASPFSDTEADFSRLSKEKLSIGQILQKSSVEFAEEGTEASSVTTTDMLVKDMDEPQPKPTVGYFYADSPFLYLIYSSTGKLCYIGTYYGDEKADAQR